MSNNILYWIIGSVTWIVFFVIFTIASISFMNARIYCIDTDKEFLKYVFFSEVPTHQLYEDLKEFNSRRLLRSVIEAELKRRRKNGDKYCTDKKIYINKRRNYYDN